MDTKEKIKTQINLEALAGEYGITFNPDGLSHCPFPERHNNGDHNPSLHLNRKTQRIYCESQHCFGEKGADVFGVVQVMEKVDFKTAYQKLASRIGASNNGHHHHTKPKVTATFDYRDERGDLLYQVQRVEPGKNGRSKDFCIRKPGRNGGWDYTSKGVRLIPYRLFEFLKTVGLVVISEGEGCVDEFLRLDISATCNPFGAGKWCEFYNDHFVGCDVVIWPDKDEAGESHAKAMAESLIRSGKPASVRIVDVPAELPVKGDIVDLMKLPGWTKDRILEVIANAKPYSNVSKTEAGEWSVPQPIPDILPPVESFRLDLLPSAFQPWIRDIADRMQCPIDYPAVGAMVALSAVVGRQIAIRPKVSDDWQVIANLWGGVVGRPGLLKTPALAEALRPLDRLEAQAHDSHKEMMQTFEGEKLVREAKLKHLKGEMQKALRDGGDPHQLAQAALLADEVPPTRRRYRTNDPSMEKLGELLNENPRGLLLFRDELTGFLRTLDREGHESDRSFYLEAWNGTGSFVFDRIGRGTIDIQAACISILGGIQPGPLSAYMSRAAHGGQDDDGLMQRFQLIVWPDLPAQWQDVDRAPDMAARLRAFDVFDRMDTINPESIGAQVPKEEGDLPFLRFAPEAQAVFIEWRAELEHRLRGENLAPMMEAHLAKFRSLIPALALLIHLADEEYGPVGADSLVRACAWGDYLESHAIRLYAPALSPDITVASALATRIRKGDLSGEFNARDIYRKHWTGLDDKEAVQAGLDFLEDMGWVQKVETPTAGRPRVSYNINPHIGGATT